MTKEITTGNSLSCVFATFVNTWWHLQVWVHNFNFVVDGEILVTGQTKISSINLGIELVMLSLFTDNMITYLEDPRR